LSQPRRRRRRRGRGRGGQGGQGGQGGDGARKQQQAGGQGPPQQPQSGAKKSRRRRGRGRGQQRQSSPKSSEDLVRALPREAPATLTAPADGQTLEGIIGELQSVWGVPQYPQEYRITIKVAEEKDQRPDTSSDEVARTSEAPARTNGEGPRREKAPAAPLMRMRGEGAQSEEGAPRKRRRGRRRRRGGGGGGGPAPSSS
jgi:hypothetical protein